jgi:hypothetical protein
VVDWSKSQKGDDGRSSTARGLRHVNTELEQLAVDPRRAPEGIGGGHAPDKAANLATHRRSARIVSLGLSAPVSLEPLGVPPKDRSWHSGNEARAVS